MFKKRALIRNNNNLENFLAYHGTNLVRNTGIDITLICRCLEKQLSVNSNTFALQNCGGKDE